MLETLLNCEKISLFKAFENNANTLANNTCFFKSNALVTEDAKLTVPLNNNLCSQMKVDAMDCDANFHTLSFKIVQDILFKHKRILQTMLML